MLLEDLLLAVAVGAVLVAIGLPIVRLLKAAPWRREDPLAAAQERLRIAKIEAEIAKVNREAESIYERLYEEAMTGDRSGGGGGRRIAADERQDGALDEEPQGTGKGQRNGQG
ncbi:MAG: hypothetical protein ABTD50_03870 [Polyangiaceae bacterium]|jgi:hypothetical protein